MIFLSLLYSQINLIVFISDVHDLLSPKAENPDKESQQHQSNNQACYFGRCDCIGFSKVKTPFIFLHNWGFSVHIWIAIVAKLPVSRWLINLEDPIRFVGVIIRVEVILEVCGLNRLQIHFLLKLVDVFPPQAVGVLFVVVIRWCQFVKITTDTGLNTIAKLANVRRFEQSFLIITIVIANLKLNQASLVIHLERVRVFHQCVGVALFAGQERINLVNRLFIGDHLIGLRL